MLMRMLLLFGVWAALVPDSVNSTFDRPDPLDGRPGRLDDLGDLLKRSV